MLYKKSRLSSVNLCESLLLFLSGEPLKLYQTGCRTLLLFSGLSRRVQLGSSLAPGWPLAGSLKVVRLGVASVWPLYNQGLTGCTAEMAVLLISSHHHTEPLGFHHSDLHGFWLLP